MLVEGMVDLKERAEAHLLGLFLEHSHGLGSRGDLIRDPLEFCGVARSGVELEY